MSRGTTRLALHATVAILVALVAGSVLGAIGSKVYAVLVFPAACGLVVGYSTSSAGRAFKVHGAGAATATGVAAGLLGFAAILSVGAQIERASAVAEYSARRGFGDALIQKAAESYMRDAAGGHEGVLQPLFLRVHSGARLVADTSMGLGPAGNAVVLVLEAAACVYLAARLARRGATDPFCERCDAWHARRIVGTAPLGSLASLRAAMQEREYHKLGRRLHPPTDRRQPVVLHGRFCDTCSDGRIHLELEVAEAGKRPRVVQRVDESHDALDAILDSHALKASFTTSGSRHPQPAGGSEHA